jgi:hypothetical protein
MFFKWENNEMVMKPEALAVKAFKNIWDADKSKEKTRAMNTFSLLYFMHDPRSEYQFDVDERSRLELIKEHMGLDAKMEKDKLYLAAIPVYRSMIHTPSSQTLASNMKLLKAIRAYLDDVVVDDDNISKVVKAVSDVNKLAVDIAAAEKAVHAEVEEKLNNARGNARLTIGDEGLEKLFES